MKPRQLEILQHSLGVDQYGITPKGFTPYTRNWFCAGASDEPTCRELVAMGFMQQMETTQLFPYLNCKVTPEGILAMKSESPQPPKLSRSQQRYRRFLNADSSMTFREWLRHEGRQTA